MSIVIIFGEQGSGKTSHAKRFAAHYKKKTIIDEDGALEDDSVVLIQPRALGATILTAIAYGLEFQTLWIRDALRAIEE